MEPKICKAKDETSNKGSSKNHRQLALKQTRAQAETQHCVAASESMSQQSNALKFEMRGIKDMISASLQVIAEERNR